MTTMTVAPETGIIRNADGDLLIGEPLARALDAARTLEQAVANCLIERAEAVHLGLVALASRHHMVLLGEPGTSKSMLFALLAQGIGQARTFHYLLTAYTDPNEVFGPPSLKALREHDQLVRELDGRAATAEIFIAEELFKANPKLLNSMLMLMNERVVSNPHIVDVPLVSVLGSSNEFPDAEETEALRDRIAIRYHVEYVNDQQFGALLRLYERQAAPTIPVTLTLEQLRLIQASVEQVGVPDTVLQLFADLRKALRAERVVISDRRWCWALDISRAQALLRGSAVVQEVDLLPLKHVLWERPDQRQAVTGVIDEFIGAMQARLVELRADAKSVVDTLTAVLSGDAQLPPGMTPTQLKAETISKLTAIANEAQSITLRYGGKGKIAKAAAELNQQILDQRKFALSQRA